MKQTDDNADTASFVDYVSQLVASKYGDDALYKEGLKIYTTMDLEKQRAAAEALRQLPDNYKDENGLTQPQGALVSIDPRNGHILAMVGGRGQDSFNRATMAVRQPGSAFKPFVYMTALQHDMSPYSTMEDKAISYGSWSPQNSDMTFRGKISLADALALSVNTVAVQLADEVGPSNIIANVKKMGITTMEKDDDNLAMALGGLTRGVTPLEMASAYGTFANRGVHVKPVAIVKILDRNGNVLENESTLNQDKNKTQVMSEKEAYEMTYMLEGVIDHGTGTGAAIGRPAAGKTGTTDNNVDAWFVGYTPTIVTAVWIGDDSGSHSLGEVYGGTIPAAIWRDYMTVATQDESYEGFAIPAGMEPIAPPPKEEPKPKADDKKDAAKDKGQKSREPTAQNDESSDAGERAAEERAVQQAARNNKEE